MESVELGNGQKASYLKCPTQFDSSKPTLVLLHTYASTVEYYAAQYNESSLTDAVNILAVDEIGHGGTNNIGLWDFDDQARLVVQVMEHVGVERAYVWGTSQGGAMAARVALAKPSAVRGLILASTSMYAETEEARNLGSWDLPSICNPWFESWLGTPDPTFEPPQAFIDGLMGLGFGEDVPADYKTNATAQIKANYSGEQGRARLAQVTASLRDRASLGPRLGEIQCPVLIIHGDHDTVFGPGIAKKMHGDFKHTDVSLHLLPGAPHFLTITRAKQVNKLVLDFIQRNSTL